MLIFKWTDTLSWAIPLEIWACTCSVFCKYFLEYNSQLDATVCLTKFCRHPLPQSGLTIPINLQVGKEKASLEIFRKMKVFVLDNYLDPEKILWDIKTEVKDEDKFLKAFWIFRLISLENNHIRIFKCDTISYLNPLSLFRWIRLEFQVFFSVNPGFLNQTYSRVLYYAQFLFWAPRACANYFSELFFKLRMLIFLINSSDKSILNYFADKGLFFLHSRKKNCLTDFMFLEILRVEYTLILMIYQIFQTIFVEI